jgi:tetratricopeptide (TPR) repeat protein
MGIYVFLLLMLLVLIFAGAIFWLWKLKNEAEHSVRQLQDEINKLTPLAFARDFARLSQYQRRVGVVFIDGLPVSSRSAVKRGYEAGLKFAEQGMWDRAYQCWNEVKSAAQGNELAALYFLCGGCLVIRHQFTEAEEELNKALKICLQTGNKSGITAVLYLLAGLAREQGQAQRAIRLLEGVIRNEKGGGNAELIGKALVRQAEVYLDIRLPEAAINCYRQALKHFEAVGNANLVSAQYRSIGNIYFQLGELDKARAAYEDGLHLARESHNRIGEAESLTAIGRVHRMQGDFRRALDVLDRALRIYRESNFIRGQAQVLHELARVHEKNSELDIAQEFFEQSLLLTRRIRDNRMMVNNLLGLALNALLHYNQDRAKVLIDEAVNIGKQLKSTDVAIRIDLVLAQFHMMRGEFEQAIAVLNEVVCSAREINDRRHEAKGVLGLVTAFRLAGRIKDGEKAMKQFWIIIKEAPDMEMEADAWREEGLLWAANEQFTPALDLLRRAYDRHLRLGGKRAAVADLIYIGEIMFFNRQFTEAKSVLQPAVNTAEEVGDPGIQAQALSLLGDVLHALQEVGSIECYSRALDLYRSIGDHRGEANSLKKLGVVCYEKRDWSRARDYLEQSLRIFQRLNDSDGIDAVRAIMNQLPQTEIGLKFTAEY